MSLNIKIGANYIWAFYQHNADKLTDRMALVATTGDHSMYITSKGGLPELIVFDKGDKVLYQETAVSGEDLYAAMMGVLRKHLLPDIMTVEGDGDEEDEKKQHDIIKARDAALLKAYRSFLNVILDEKGKTSYTEAEDENDMEDMEKVLECIAYDLDLTGIDHPMMIIPKGEDKAVFCRHPYDEYDMRS